MTHEKLATILVGLVLLAGCGRQEAPLAGGRPISRWLDAAKASDPQVRIQAVAKLGNAGDSNPQVLPALIAALKDREPRVRCAAILAIVKVGDGSESVMKPLELAESDPDAKVREYARKALIRLASTKPAGR